MWTQLSRAAIGPVDYHCRAPFRPSVPWCFPVWEVRFFKAICWLRAHQQEEGLVAGAAAAGSSAAATTEVAAETQLSRAAKSWKFVFLTRVSEGTVGLVDYHCRAPFRPSVPWCFPVREVRFFKAICWLKDVASKVAAEQLTAGAGQQEGHVDKLPRAAKS